MARPISPTSTASSKTSSNRSSESPPAQESHTIVIRSTVPPGTVEDVTAVVQSALGETGLDVTVAVCPEFLREGTGIADFLSPPYTVIGASDLRAIDTVSRLFAFLDAPLRVVHPRTAEALKYACNAFHATKVSFANELGRILSRLGVDSREVMEIFCEDTALNISPKYLRPGFAFGGSCLPKDLRSLLYLARAESIDVPLLSGALASNRLTIDEAIDRVVGSEGLRVALLGLSFKPEATISARALTSIWQRPCSGRGTRCASTTPSSTLRLWSVRIVSTWSRGSRTSGGSLPTDPRRPLRVPTSPSCPTRRRRWWRLSWPLPLRRSSISPVASDPRSRRWSATRDSPGERPGQRAHRRREKGRNGSAEVGTQKRGRVLILVQNLSVPFDRRVWLECQSLIAAGFRVAVVCPKAPGDPTYYRLRGVDLFKYRPYRTGYVEHLLRPRIRVLVHHDAGAQPQGEPRRSIRRRAELQSPGPLLAHRSPLSRPQRVVLRFRSPRSLPRALPLSLPGREPVRVSSAAAHGAMHGKDS